MASIQAVADSALGVRLEITWNPYREGERGDAAAMVAEVASRTLELRGLLGTHLVSAAPLTDREVADAHRDTACGGNQGSGEE
ncbi:hypothetical protein [Nocardia sp. IFM 10818]